MPETTDQLLMIDVRAVWRRVLFVVPPTLMALACAWFAVCWYVGDTMAEFASQLSDPRRSEAEMEGVRLETARSAVRLAPDDPLTHWALASMERRIFGPEQLASVVRHYEQAVALSPNDFRLWMELGRARESAGDIRGAEEAFRRAVVLAPFYAHPRWLLGNLLLRARRTEEAFAELRRAAAADRKLRRQVLDFAWRVYGQDVESVKRAVGDSPAALADLASYLAGHGRLDDALALWSGLGPEVKREQRATGEQLLNSLLTAKRYRAAVGVVNDLSPGAEAVAAGQLVDGGFEGDVGAAGIFAWQVTSAPQAQVGLDQAVRHEGARSLRVTFKASSNPGLNISQLVAVESATTYRLTCWVRAQDLRSAGTPLIEVLSAQDGGVLGRGAPLPVGSSDWQEVRIEFKVSAQTEAINVRVNRASCGADAPVCPIFGTVWYDDFNLQRMGGGGHK